MKEKLKIKPNQEQDFLKDAKKIFLSWKEADKTYNSNGVTNKMIRKKFKEYERKYLKIKQEYESIGEKITDNLSSLKSDIEKLKRQNIKDYKIQTLASIVFNIEKDNKELGFDKIVKKYGYDNISDVYSNKDNLLIIIEALSGTEDESEKQLLAYLEPILYFYNYKESEEDELVEIDLEDEETRKVFSQEIRNYSKQEEIYNKKDKNAEQKSSIIPSIEDNYENYSDIGIIENGKNYYIASEEGKEIEITKKEVEEIQNNPESKDKLINLNKQLLEVNIDFAWDNRKNLIREMRRIEDFNEDQNFVKYSSILTENGIRNYLQFLVVLTGEKGNIKNLSMTNLKTKIRELNNESFAGEEVNRDSGFKPFGQKLINNGIFNRFGIFDSFSAKITIDKIIKKQEK